MINKKTMDYHKEKIKELERENRDLKIQLSDSLRKCDYLMNDIERLQLSFKEFKMIHDKTLSEYEQGIEEVKQLKNEARLIINDILLEKNKYKKQMKELLKNVKKTNRQLKLYCSVCGDEIDGDNYTIEDGHMICDYCKAERHEE